MASGIPIVCSDSSCLPELASNVALTCSADDIEALTINLERGLLDEAWRTEAISNGLSRASKLSRSEENTSELQSLMRISYAVLCLKKKKIKYHEQIQQQKT